MPNLIVCPNNYRLTIILVFVLSNPRGNDTLLITLLLDTILCTCNLDASTTKINGVATDLFCTGVIGHPGCMFLN